MNLKKLLIPTVLFVALVAVAQGTTNVNERMKNAEWQSPPAPRVRGGRN